VVVEALGHVDDEPWNGVPSEEGSPLPDLVVGLGETRLEGGSAELVLAWSVQNRALGLRAGVAVALTWASGTRTDT